MTLLFAVILLIVPSGWANAKPCTKEVKGPRTPTPEVKKEILRLSELGLQHRVEWLKYKSDEMKTREAINKEDGRRHLHKNGKGELSEDQFLALYNKWQRNYDGMVLYRGKAEKKLYAALRLTTDCYHVNYPPSKPIRGGRAEGTRPVEKLKIWLGGDNDYASTSTVKSGTYYAYFPANDVIDKNGKAIITGLKNLEGITFTNGQILLNADLFQRAVNEKNPGEIAVTVFHENVHRYGLTSGRNFAGDAGELAAYGYSHDLADVFQLRVNSDSRVFLEQQVEKFNASVYGKKQSLFKEGYSTMRNPAPWHYRALDKLGLTEAWPTPMQQADINFLSRATLEELANIQRQQITYVSARQRRLKEKLAKDKANKIKDEKKKKQVIRDNSDEHWRAQNKAVSLSEDLCDALPQDRAAIFDEADFSKIWKALHHLPAFHDQPVRMATNRCARGLIMEILKDVKKMSKFRIFGWHPMRSRLKHVETYFARLEHQPTKHKIGRILKTPKPSDRTMK